MAVVFREGTGYATILSGKIGYPEGRVGVCGEMIGFWRGLWGRECGYVDKMWKIKGRSGARWRFWVWGGCDGGGDGLFLGRSSGIREVVRVLGC